MRRLIALACLPLCSMVLAACATTTSTSKFQGAEHEVAQTVANLQSDVTASEQKKICADELSAAVVSRLGGIKGCEAAIKEQMAEIDSTELEVESVKVSGDTATATVKSVYSGKRTSHTLTLVKEGGKWKISSLQ
ncbi:MAG: nuclear transport factor 2 family protein [Solirubrobacteraceae bacterium]